MTDFPQIRADAARTADDLEKAIGWLQREYELWEDDPESQYFDPEWTVHLDHPQAKQLIEGLKGIRGLLWHLGNNPDAAAALASQHAEAMLALPPK